MAITVVHFDKVEGDALTLWDEGNESYRTAELGFSHPRNKHPLNEAYVAYVDGEVAAVCVVFAWLGDTRVDQQLSYTRPQFRGLGAWAAADDAAQSHLHQRGYTYFVSTVIEGVPGMREAVEGRGAVVTSTNYRRPITNRGGEE